MSKQYTRSEVVNSNSKEKILIILHDKVYDVLSFLNEHPGGEEILLDHRGKDGSEDFDDVGHSKDAFDLMSKYQVGELIESERSNNAPKLSWTSGYTKDDKNKDQGISQSVLAIIVVVLIAIVYYVYL
ncbi:Cytochrome b5 [Eufriesea mexicana]|uniref:Cytochrome b5 n=1 Tax=Eufriesea mexicana TaxID=516756 RepID=A0A310SQL3_9HYME|nr:PREDICTED: cytochrome b5-like [Eufriesea mexicana]XP_017755055.1 PREDICTED: cytochrome b5-like [Eufriesea mexicana]XP_017755057.1 PREDICTED: cytochrome b5-like [Eufriesea mexicana]OAD58500.1 Cytochrome b5 [Eufriesea mexicana]